MMVKYNTLKAGSASISPGLSEISIAHYVQKRIQWVVDWYFTIYNYQ